MLLLLACTEPEIDTGKIAAIDTGTVTDTSTTTAPEDLGDPYLALVAPVPPGFLSADCVMRVELFSGDVSLAIIEINPALGGEWAGMDLEGDKQYKISAYHSTCNDQTPAETTESGTFSGVAGLMFTYRFNGTNSGVESLEQTVDFAGGTIYVTLEPGTSSQEISNIAATFGGSVAVGAEADVWVVSFPTDVPIGRVLTAMTDAEGFIEGAPDWLDKPGWW